MSYKNNPLSSLTKGAVFRLLLPLTLTLGTTLTIATRPVTASEPAPRNRLTIVEIRLLRDLIDGHNFAVQMAQVCVDKDIRQELKSMCEQVITAQQQQIQTMQSWLSDWYGIDYTPTPNNFSRNVLGKLEGLNGSDFEIAFMENLTSHHWGAIEFGGEIIDRAYHQEFVKLATDVITEQVGEINQLRTMLKEVYGIDYNGAAAAGSAAINPEPSFLAPSTSNNGSSK